MSGTIRIGVLALQGSVVEHMRMLRKLDGVEAFEVKDPQTLMQADGLILPGGESTTIGKLLRDFSLFEPLKERITEDKLPVWGTCAGLILLARNVEGESAYLGVFDMTVRRNAYGRQIDSFSKEVVIPEVSDKAIPLVFIRAPWIESLGEGARELCNLDGHIVAARQEHMLVTSFHPELTDDLSFHEYFKEMIKSNR